MRRLRGLILAPLLVLITVAGLTSAVDPAAAQRAAVVGAAGAGDPYYPRQGNGGYEAQHYSVHISYDPVSRVLRGVVTMSARSVLDLRRFDLDLRTTMHVSSVVVDGRRAGFAQPASAVQELVITPARVLNTGHHFVVTVTYSGRPGEITDADGSPDGWIRTDDGAFVADEPQGMPTWMPVNDTPRDKATYTVLINTPRIYGAISNGRLRSIRTYRTSHTYTWVLRQPVSSYLVTATIGRFKLYRGTTASGLPYVNAIDPTLLRSGRAVLAKLPAVIDYFSARFGRYPFDAVGGVVDNTPRVGYALETATRPIFDTTPSVQTLSHELAHQWFGDDVTLRRWRDIWLHEGFAEFCSWLWDEHTGVQSAASHLREVMSRPASSSSTWNPPPGNPGSAGAVFSDSVYVRGAAALQALREKVGNTTFFRILRGWLAAHRYGKATTGEFTVYAERVAHRDLTPFFQRWLYRSGKP